MNASSLRTALHAGQRVFGSLVISESPLWPRAIATSGVDFVFIDTEHIALTDHQVAAMCSAYRGYDLTPLVRIPRPDPYQAAKMLDVGAGGIIAPYIESAAEARALVGAVRYRPLKGQRLQQALDGQALEPQLQQYLDQRNAEHLLVLNIESTPSMEKLSEILSVPGIDAALIGPHDLSCSLGLPEEYDHPTFLDACQQIFQTARQHNLGAGIHSMGSVSQQIRYMNLGANMMIHSADLMLATQALQRDLNAIRTAVGEATLQDQTELDAI